MTRAYDAVIIGAGHNGLVCAFYLARAGYRVRIVERRAIVGGAAVTEEFHPGFRNSVASYTVSLLHPRIIRDMALAEHGYRVLERPISTFFPRSDERVTSVPAVDGRVKSGAGDPTAGMLDPAARAVTPASQARSAAPAPAG